MGEKINKYALSLFSSVHCFYSGSSGVQKVLNNNLAKLSLLTVTQKLVTLEIALIPEAHVQLSKHFYFIN